MNDRIRFGLIGCGSQGKFLSEALRLTGEADMVACCDVDEESAEATAAGWGWGRGFASAEALLAEAEVDAIIVATRHDQLQPCGVAVIEAGKHLFIEKPMALNAGQARELAEAAEKAGLRGMVGYTLPFLPARRKLRQLLDGGAAGDIAHVFGGQLIGPLGGWLAEPQCGGGPLLYIGSHVIYQVLDVVRQPVQGVFAHCSFTETGVDRECLLTVEFSGGVTAQIAVSQRLGGRYGWLDVIGSAGRLRSEWESNLVQVQSSRLDTYRHLTTIEVPDDFVGPRLRLGDAASLVGQRYLRAWADELAAFITAIRENTPPPASLNDGVRVLEVIDAALRSGESGTWEDV